MWMFLSYELWLIQLSHTADQKVTCNIVFGAELCIFASLCRGDLDFPLFVLVVP